MNLRDLIILKWWVILFVCCSINYLYCYKYAKYTIIGDVYHCTCNTKVNRTCTITLNSTFFWKKQKSKYIDFLYGFVPDWPASLAPSVSLFWSDVQLVG
jgi:hypothetical protein